MSDNYIDFDWEKYINSYEDLKYNIKTQYDAINHWKIFGILENRVYSINFNNFNWRKYIDSYDDLKNNIKYKNEAIDHWINYGKNENRVFYMYENNYIFDNIEIFCRDDIENNKYLFNINYFNFKDTYIDNPVIIKKFFNNINIIKSHNNDIKNKSFIFINNKIISFEYLEFWKKSIKKILDQYNYDIIELTINNDYNFNNVIESNIEVNDIINKNGLVLDAYYISESGVKKILNNNIDLINNWKVGSYSRPLFGYFNDINYNLWKSYYRVVSYWNKVYCINLGFDIEKRKDMMKYCNLLNSTEDNFFIDGLLGLNLPDINTLVDMNIYNKSVVSHNIKIGTFGLNIIQHDIMKESINNNYKYTLILEDDIYFESEYFKVLNYIFNKYNDIDILMLGFSNCENDNFDNLCNRIDKYRNYNIFIPKKNLLQKICIGGFYAVLLSQKALKIYYERFTPINNISDVLLCDIIFDIKKDFSDDIMTKTNYNLKSYLIKEDLFKVITDKPSLTEENNFNMLDNFTNNKSIQYLSKIKKLNFKIDRNYHITIYIGNSIKEYYKPLINIVLNKFKNYKIVDNINESLDIVIFTDFDNLNLNKSSINIFINGENEVIRPCNSYTDIAILSSKIMKYNYNIYLPQLFTSLWERRTNYKNVLNNSREKFCAYMYSYDLEYRVELYNFISQYKKVDALGKSCNNIIEDDRFLYNDNLTYNDTAIQKYSKYKFVLALENGIADGYITEKLINPIIAGSIPIYAGSKDTFEIINKKRVIYVYDFENYDKLLEYIKIVDNNNDLYNYIVSEPIFIGNLNWDNFEKYISDNIDKALGFKLKNILITNNDYENNNFENNNYDFIIKNFDISSINKQYIKRYFSNYTNYNDKLYIKKIIDKINFIDHILWINLNRKKNRKKYMKNILSYVPIKNTRINAIDGKLEDVRKMIYPLQTNITDYEIACTLSHVKAINYLKNIQGEYFMICEDDIAFDNIFLINQNLESIIKNSPNFDILLLNKTYLNNLNDTYTNWLSEKNKSNNYSTTIWSTVCYIISRKGVDKLCNKISFINNNFYFNINNINIADEFLYSELNTFVYKYNFINTLNEESTIHDNHIDYHKQVADYQLKIIKKDFCNI